MPIPSATASPQKFLFAVRGTLDPFAMTGVGFGAGIENDGGFTPPNYS
jgi:hypothetical protein